MKMIGHIRSRLIMLLCKNFIKKFVTTNDIIEIHCKNGDIIITERDSIKSDIENLIENLMQNSKKEN